jgi:hypothetical protein
MTRVQSFTLMFLAFTGVLAGPHAEAGHRGRRVSHCQNLSTHQQCCVWHVVYVWENSQWNWAAAYTTFSHAVAVHNRYWLQGKPAKICWQVVPCAYAACDGSPGRQKGGRENYCIHICDMGAWITTCGYDTPEDAMRQCPAGKLCAVSKEGADPDLPDCVGYYGCSASCPQPRASRHRCR